MICGKSEALLFWWWLSIYFSILFPRFAAFRTRGKSSAASQWEATEAMQKW